jgi:hypothetical protein
MTRHRPPGGAFCFSASRKNAEVILPSGKIKALATEVLPLPPPMTSCGHIGMALCDVPEIDMVKKSSDLLTRFP